MQEEKHSMDSEAYQAFRRRITTAIWRDLDPLEDEIETTGALPYDRLWPLLRARQRWRR